MSTEAAHIIGGYRLIKVLATGQNSQVWEAAQEGSLRRVALKLLLRERLAEREQAAALRREAEVAKQLEHPNIIKVFEYQRNRVGADGPFFVMEYFPAQNLKLQIMRDSSALWPRAHRIITQVAQALAYAHDKGWVHRDVKPDNILVNKSGEVRLIDFALATRIQGRLGRLFAPKGKIQGTRSYMSPEQIRGERLHGHSDLYALGVTIFEMLAGRPPFRGNNPDDLLLRHLRQPAPSLSSAGVEVTPEFDQLLLRMLAKKREDRPENLHSFLIEFRKTRISPKDTVAQEESLDAMGG